MSLCQRNCDLIFKSFAPISLAKGIWALRNLRINKSRLYDADCIMLELCICLLSYVGACTHLGKCNSLKNILWIVENTKDQLKVFDLPVPYFISFPH